MVFVITEDIVIVADPVDVLDTVDDADIVEVLACESLIKAVTEDVTLLELVLELDADLLIVGVPLDDFDAIGLFEFVLVWEEVLDSLPLFVYNGDPEFWIVADDDDDPDSEIDISELIVEKNVFVTENESNRDLVDIIDDVKLFWGDCDTDLLCIPVFDILLDPDTVPLGFNWVGEILDDRVILGLTDRVFDPILDTVAVGLPVTVLLVVILELEVFETVLLELCVELEVPDFVRIIDLENTGELEAVFEDVMVAVDVRELYSVPDNTGDRDTDTDPVEVLEGFIDPDTVPDPVVVFELGGDLVIVVLDVAVLDFVTEDVPVFDLAIVLVVNGDPVIVFDDAHESVGLGLDDDVLESLADLVNSSVWGAELVNIPDCVLIRVWTADGVRRDDLVDVFDAVAESVVTAPIISRFLCIIKLLLSGGVEAMDPNIDKIRIHRISVST
jgi:hypothetical protein